MWSILNLFGASSCHELSVLGSMELCPSKLRNNRGIYTEETNQSKLILIRI